MTENERIKLNRDHPHCLMGELDAIYFYVGFLQLELLNLLSSDEAEKVEAKLERTIKDKLNSLGRTPYETGFEEGLKTLQSKLV